MKESDERIDKAYLFYAEWPKLIANAAIKRMENKGYSVFFADRFFTFWYKTPDGEVLCNRIIESAIKPIPNETIKEKSTGSIAGDLVMCDRLYVDALVSKWESELGSKDDNCLVLQLPFVHSSVLGLLHDKDSFSTRFGKFQANCSFLTSDEVE